MQTRQAAFNNRFLPLLFVAPQILVTLVFFIWPASQAVYQSFLQEDVFGFNTSFVWFNNFTELFEDEFYLHSFYTTILFCSLVTFLSLSVSLFFATLVDKLIKAQAVFKTFFIVPYAVAPAVAGILWMYLFNPSIGFVAQILKSLGIDWNHLLNGDQAMLLVVIAASWKQISYNFVFFLAGLQSIPKSMIEAAAIDGAGSRKRFWTIIFPLLSPTTFFLIVMNIVYAFFETFGIIHAVTGGGPGKATETLVFKVWYDGFQANEFGSSAAQSVILMGLVILLTVIQFRYVERRVHY